MFTIYEFYIYMHLLYTYFVYCLCILYLYCYISILCDFAIIVSELCMFVLYSTYPISCL